MLPPAAAFRSPSRRMAGAPNFMYRRPRSVITPGVSSSWKYWSTKRRRFVYSSSASFSGVAGSGSRRAQNCSRKASRSFPSRRWYCLRSAFVMKASTLASQTLSSAVSLVEGAPGAVASVRARARQNRGHGEPVERRGSPVRGRGSPAR